MAPSDALLYPIAGRVDYDERRAIYWVPNERTEKEIVGLPDDVNSRRVRKLHRIAVCSDYGDIELAFAIRHELEHARQIECHGRELGELHGLIEDMLRGESNALYNAMPMECDANGPQRGSSERSFPPKMFATTFPLAASLVKSSGRTMPRSRSGVFGVERLSTP